MSTRGRKQRPWRTIRCVVEVKVPPSNRSTEKDLSYQLEQALEIADDRNSPFNSGLPLPRAILDNCYWANPKVKGFTHVFRAEAKRPPERSVFERLVARALYAILVFSTRSHNESAASRAIRDDLAAFLTVES